MTIRRWVAISLVSIGFLLAADVVRAHDPIILTDEQTTPDSGPFLPDGTISFALYGAFDAAGETRGLRAQFVKGDRLHVSLLIPNLAPENILSDDELPALEIIDPDGAVLRLEPETRTIFDEPFTGTSYVELVDHVDEAAAGIYAITVIGGAPSRFTVSVGDKETFGTPVEGVVDRSAGVAGVMQWYEGSPAPEMTETTTPESETTQTPNVDSSQRNNENLEVAGPEDTEQDGALRTVIVLLVVLFLVVVVGISRKIRRRSTKSSQR
jgi:hypothetical protein